MHADAHVEVVHFEHPAHVLDECKDLEAFPTSAGPFSRPGSEAEGHSDSLTNPFGLDEASGALADEMRMKLLYDMAYTASLEKLSTFLSMELLIIAKTPVVMLGGLGR